MTAASEESVAVGENIQGHRRGEDDQRPLVLATDPAHVIDVLRESRVRREMYHEVGPAVLHRYVGQRERVVAAGEQDSAINATADSRCIQNIHFEYREGLTVWFWAFHDGCFDSVGWWADFFVSRNTFHRVSRYDRERKTGRWYHRIKRI